MTAIVERGSGNVFADLGCSDADPHHMNAELVSRIDDILRDRRITHSDLANSPYIDYIDLKKYLWSQS